MIGGLIAFALYLYFFVGIGQLVSALGKINTGEYLLFYSLAIGTLVLALLCWTASWKTILQTLAVKLSLKKAFMIFWVGFFVDLVVPSETVGSELTRLYLVHNETKGDLGAIAASAVTNRIAEYLIVASGLSISVIIMVSSGNIPAVISGFLILVLSGALIYLAILLYLALSENAATVLISIWYKLKRLVRLRQSSSIDMSDKAKKSLVIFYEGFKIFRQNPRHLIKPLIFQIFTFLLNLVVYVLVFEALGFQYLPFEFYILIYFVASAIQATTATLSVGSLDIILTTIFILYGIPKAVSGIAVVVLRSAIYWIPLLISYIVVQVVGVRNILEKQSEEKITAGTLGGT
jgi:uncharacterized protein (TIRG00374 family)